MHQLVGRLAAVDPQAGESLKVIEFFDTLTTGQAGVPAIVRAGAVLSGATAGVALDGRVLRFDPEGRAQGGPTAPVVAAHEVGDASGWLEREGEGEPHANDAIIVERMTLAATTAHARRQPATASAELLLDEHADPEARARAAGALRLTGASVAVVATLPTDPDPGCGPAVIVATRYGVLRASLTVDPPASPAHPTGVGVAGGWETLPRSWRSAVVALRLSGSPRPLFRAQDLGVVLDAALAADAAAPGAPPHPDVAALLALRDDHARDDRRDLLTTMDALVEHGSVRAAAVALGMHHSTVQARLPRALDRLGYDPRSTLGRMRYTAARQLLALRESRLP
ncbi:helix-turn-helix domain-containing protein [Leifsonia sp. 71-9]|uniref:helix-turn-helix domain-containing protein n=1 Tax=Leifsonia sp. 71-9 TaxID=1895934 RepID=UPI0009276090|nr:helix-turn-helix domain-containing protein [Leifsonia sp. 71-9]OJX80368.1 MAG: hypothetical protein BGO91_08780 [Leifsonia sp. 71-9]